MEAHQQKFEQMILSMAAWYGHIQDAPHSDATPAELSDKLNAIDKCLTRALQELSPLNLEHVEGQDLHGSPYNWKLAQLISAGLPLFVDGELSRHDPAYPTGPIQQIRSLRDAAREAIKQVKPVRGNAYSRSASTARKKVVAMNFVFSYQLHFERLPPSTSTGWEVELMEKAFEAAGADPCGAAHWLRRETKSRRAVLCMAGIAM